MKSLFLVASMLFSASSFAVFNEVVCEGKVGEKTFSVEVEQAFPRDSSFQRANLIVNENGAQTVEDFNGVFKRVSRGMPRIQYTGGGLRLEVDLWPDQTPRWGRTYQGTVRAKTLGNKEVRNLDCRFEPVL